MAALGPSPAPWRTLLAVAAGLALLAATAQALVLLPGGYAGLARLGQLSYHENGFRYLRLALTPARYQLLRLGLGLAAALGTLGLATGRRAARQLRAELARGWHHGRRWWQAQSPTERGAAGLVLLVLLAARSYYLLAAPLSTDEVGSYDFFVRRGPGVISSFYPIPNNHILYNLLAWPLAALGGCPRLVMRLPTLLLGTLGTALGGVLLARLLGWPRTLLLLGLALLAPLWVYYAANGRGYLLQLVLLLPGLAATVELLRPATPYRHLSWATWLLTAVLGLYTIPTYAYPLAALGLGLAAGLLGQKRWTELPTLALAGALVAGLTLLLYAPVGVVSGWEQLLGNRYVTARPAFWLHYRGALYELAADVWGPPLRYSGPAWLGLAALGGVLAWHRLSAGPARTLALLAWWQLALPLGLMAAQRVYAPTRVLLYLTGFGYLLVLLLLLPRRGPKGWPWLLALVLSLGGYRLWLDQAHLQAMRHETQQFRQAFAWLQAPLHELFFAHYLQQQAHPALVLRSGQRVPAPGTYDFLVLNTRRGQALAPPGPPYHAVYRDELVTIYSLPSRPR